MCYYSESQRSQQKYLRSNKELSGRSGIRIYIVSFEAETSKWRTCDVRTMKSSQQITEKSELAPPSSNAPVQNQFVLFARVHPLMVFRSLLFFSSARNTQWVTGKLLWVTSPAVPRYPLCCFITSRTWLEYKYGIFHALHAVWKTTTWSPSRLADKWQQSTLLAMCVSVRARNSLSNFSCQIAADEPTIILLSPTGLINTCTVTLLSTRR